MAAAGSLSLQDLSPQIRNQAHQGRLTSAEVTEAVRQGLGEFVSCALDDHLLSLDEEQQYLSLKSALSEIVETDDLTELEKKLTKAAILRDLQGGNPIQRVHFSTHIPLIIPKSETVLWLFSNVNHYVTKRRVQYTGRSNGVSVRVAKGVYIRSGASRGERIESTQSELNDTGFLVLTNKSIHYKGSNTASRIQISKIISVEMLSDGITVFLDEKTPKPQSFSLDDPWFAANCLTSLAQ